MSENRERKRDEGIGLALSGGGFRATLFHIGALWRLNELGFFPKLKEVTSVSGGSIAAGWLGLQWNRLQFANDVATNFEELIANPLREFCSKTIDVPTVLKGWLLPFRHPSDFLIGRYRKALFGDATLQHLPAEGEGPVFTIYATSLQTGSSVRLSHKRLADYRIGEIPNPTVPLATAVAASSAFPPLYIPLKLSMDPSLWRQFSDDSADLFGRKEYRSKLYLGDGGIYDNMGLERVWDRYATVLMSDAGSPFTLKRDLGLSKFSQLARLIRTLDIINRQSRTLRRRRLMRDYLRGDMKGTFWRIGTNIEKYPLSGSGKPGPMTPYSQQVRNLAGIRTRLNKFSEEEQGLLINWGYALADAGLRAYVVEEVVPEGQWPVQRHALNRL
jgi:NTE family protein